MAVFPREIQGRWFESVAEAAAHFDVSRNAVFMAIQRGCEDGLGVGRGRVGSRKGPLFPREIQGRWFASVYEAAAHFGVSIFAVYKAIKLGREGRLGVGSGKYERPKPRPKPKPKPQPARAACALTPLERMRRAARAESAAMRRVGLR